VLAQDRYFCQAASSAFAFCICPPGVPFQFPMSESSFAPLRLMQTCKQFVCRCGSATQVQCHGLVASGAFVDNFARSPVGPDTRVPDTCVRQFDALLNRGLRARHKSLNRITTPKSSCASEQAAARAVAPVRA
jgi:hypothetical protein